jgi:GSCFA family
MYSGVRVSSRSIKCPKDESTGLVNKFTSHSILNEIEWTMRASSFSEDMIYETQGGFLDLQLVPGAKPTSLERTLQRRERADVVVITLGLVEAWYDATQNKYLNTPPSFWMARKHKDRLQLHVLDYAQNFSAIVRAVEMIGSFDKPKKIILTVSPVPLGDTLAGGDVILANSYSKSTLRSVAGACARQFSNVDYFPSYENITMMPFKEAYYADRHHVTDDVVRDNIALFFMPGLKLQTTEFSEMAYLEAHPDIDEAVRSCLFESGFDHWQKVCKAKSRALR